jgi:hypothetical protein
MPEDAARKSSIDVDWFVEWCLIRRLIHKKSFACYVL